MAGAFFFICMFVITVCGLFLLRPIQVNSITDYSMPSAIEKRKSVTLKMADFLVKNPEIVKQERLNALPLHIPHSETIPTIPPSTSPRQHHDYQLEILFQGSNLQFKSMTDFDQWLFKNVSQDPIGFLKQLQENNNPELYLDTLKKVSEMNSSDPVIEQVKNTYLEEGRNLSHNRDGFHQQMMQKAVQNYLDLEKDKALGKKNADEILETSH